MCGSRPPPRARLSPACSRSTSKPTRSGISISPGSDMPLKLDFKKFELRTLNPGLNREQLIALAAAALILVFCITAVTLSLQVRSEAYAELSDKMDALA